MIRKSVVKKDIKDIFAVMPPLSMAVKTVKYDEFGESVSKNYMLRECYASNVALILKKAFTRLGCEKVSSKYDQESVIIKFKNGELKHKISVFTDGIIAYSVGRKEKTDASYWQKYTYLALTAMILAPILRSGDVCIKTEYNMPTSILDEVSGEEEDYLFNTSNLSSFDAVAGLIFAHSTESIGTMDKDEVFEIYKALLSPYEQHKLSATHGTQMNVIDMVGALKEDILFARNTGKWGEYNERQTF